MMITPDALREEIANLEQQRQAAMVTMHQAEGAIALAQALLNALESEEQQSATLDELAQAVGGNGAKATIEPIEKNE